MSYQKVWKLLQRIPKAPFLVWMFVRFPRHFLNDVRIHPSSTISRHVTIGRGTNLNGRSYISATKQAPCDIGKYCAIAHNFRVRTENHNLAYVNLQLRLQQKLGLDCTQATKGGVKVGNNVWIGDNVIVLSGVVIGDGAVIGAGAVVARSVPPYAIAVGVPARVIKYRFPDNIIKRLNEIRWTEWPEEKLRRNRKLFSSLITDIDSDELDRLIEQ